MAKELIFTGCMNGGREAMSMANVYKASGLVNYSVPSGEARLKALEVAREINQKMDLASGLGLEEECYGQT